MLTSKEQHQQQHHEEENDPTTRTTSGGKRNQLPFLLLYVHEKKPRCSLDKRKRICRYNTVADEGV